MPSQSETHARALELDSPEIRETAEQLTGEPLVKFERPATVVHPLIYRLMAEIERQDDKHGPYQGTVLGRSRLALATLEDEIAEAVEAWRSERKALTWDHTREEVLQVAAVAIRTLRDAL